MSTLYLTFGPTHSGKTTFGRKFYDRLKVTSKVILVDNDTIEAFVKENFNNLRTDEDILRTRTPTNPDLRLRIPQLIVEYALAENYNVIVTASHSKEVIRMKYYEMAKRYRAKVVLLMFRTSKPEILKRIKDSKRDLDLTLNADSFEDLVDKQAVLLEQPSDAEKRKYDKVIEIDENNTDKQLNSLLKENDQ